MYVTSNSSRTTFKIIVDADSCPVKEAIVRVAKEESVQVMMVASVAHQITCDDEVNVVRVDNVPQAADIAILNNVSVGDIVITGDYGLASLVLSRGAISLSPRGFLYTGANIDRLLLQRHIDFKIRRGGGRTTGPKAITADDRQSFEKLLRRIMADKSGV